MTSDAITQYAKKRASIFREREREREGKRERETDVKMFDEMRKRC